MSGVYRGNLSLSLNYGLVSATMFSSGHDMCICLVANNTHHGSDELPATVNSKGSKDILRVDIKHPGRLTLRARCFSISITRVVAWTASDIVLSVHLLMLKTARSVGSGGGGGGGGGAGRAVRRLGCFCLV